MLVLMCACAADAADSGVPDKRPCSAGNELGTPAAICALRGTKELLECVREPFHYSRKRTGLELSVQCHVFGQLPDTRNEFLRRVTERDDVSIVRDMYEDWADWPEARCDLAYDISFFTDVQMAFPKGASAEASMWSADKNVIVDVQTPFAAESFVFAATDCTFESPTSL